MLRTALKLGTASALVAGALAATAAPAGAVAPAATFAENPDATAVGVTVDPISIDFGWVEMWSDWREVRVANEGDTPVSVQVPRIEGATREFRTEPSRLPRVLGPGESGTVAVGFEPSGVGPRTGSLVIPTETGDVTVALRGVGFRFDESPPTIACSTPPTAWSRQDVVISCTASDDETGLADPRDARFTLRTAVPAGTATANAVTGSRRVCDQVDNCRTAGPVRGLRVDKRAPTARLTRAAAVTLNGRATVRLRGSDVGSGVASYDTRLRTVYRSGATSGWSLPKRWQGSRATRLTRAVAAGRSTCFSTRSRDRAGNVSAWSTAVCTSAPFDDRELKASGGWKRTKGAAYLHRTLSTTTRKGATLRTRSIRGGAVALVVTRCKRCGTVVVLAGKRRVARVSLAAARTRHRQVIVLPRRAVSGPITIRTVKRGRSVRIDGVAVLPRAGSR